MKQHKVELPAPEILKRCREKLQLDLDTAIKISKVKSLHNIEKGEKSPTINQLETLARTYFQPTWIFLEKQLPANYNYNFTPAFRKLTETRSYLSYKIKHLIKEVETSRQLILDLKEQASEPVPKFQPSLQTVPNTADELANKIREWLKIPTQQQFHWENTKVAFSKWRAALENKGVFIFLTSKYNGPFKIDVEEIRGFSLYFEKIPIIVVNDADSYNAQAFTLFHELGHILKKQTQIDLDFDSNQEEEVFCNKFSSYFLMPTRYFSSEIEKNELSLQNLDQKSMSEISKILNPIAKKFKVSRETVARRLREERIITDEIYTEFRNYLMKEWRDTKKKQKEEKSGPPRERQKEILQQFGKTYITTVMNAYYKKEITLGKTCELLRAKNTRHVHMLTQLL